MTDIFNEWIRQGDVGKIYILRLFDSLLGTWMDILHQHVFNLKLFGGSSINYWKPMGDVYSCDHYVYPANNLGATYN